MTRRSGSAAARVFILPDAPAGGEDGRGVGLIFGGKIGEAHFYLLSYGTEWYGGMSPYGLLVRYYIFSDS